MMMVHDLLKFFINQATSSLNVQAMQLLQIWVFLIIRNNKICRSYLTSKQKYLVIKLLYFLKPQISHF
jgi:hypothetical protein